jgi:signal transduction histidine kinase
LAEARRLVWALRPEELGRLSLPESIRELAERWGRAARTSVTTEVTGTPRPIRPLVEVTVLRAAQEALHNIEKHARASQAAVTLSYMPDLIALDVNDNGVGFPARDLPVSVPGSPDAGYGLGLLRERVADLGGNLTIESLPGEGTTLAVSLPLPADELGDPDEADRRRRRDGPSVSRFP